MRTLSLSALLLAVAAPAYAQTYGPPAPKPRSLPVRISLEPPALPELAGQLRQIDDRIDNARESGAISRKTKKRMKREAGSIGMAHGMYAQDGLSESEARELQNRANYLSDAVAAATLKRRK